MSTDQTKLDEIAKTYHLEQNVDDKFIEDIQQHFSWSIMKKFINKNDNILELGVGEGIISQYLCETKNSVTIVEGAKLLAEQAQTTFANNNNIEVIESLFEEFKPKNKFNCILANHVLEHIDQPKELLQKMKTWLEPNATIFAIVPNADSLHRRLGVHMGLQQKTNELSARDHKVGHVRVYNYQELENDFTTNGYQIIDSGGYFPKLLSNGMMTDLSKEQIEGFLNISDQFPKELMANLWIAAKANG